MFHFANTSPLPVSSPAPSLTQLHNFFWNISSSSFVVPPPSTSSGAIFSSYSEPTSPSPLPCSLSSSMQSASSSSPSPVNLSSSPLVSPTSYPDSSIPIQSLEILLPSVSKATKPHIPHPMVTRSKTKCMSSFLSSLSAYCSYSFSSH